MILLKEKVGENHRGDYFSLMRAKPKHFQDSNIIVLFMCKKLHCWADSWSNAPFWGCGSCGKAGGCCPCPRFHFWKSCCSDATVPTDGTRWYGGGPTSHSPENNEGLQATIRGRESMIMVPAYVPNKMHRGAWNWCNKAILSLSAIYTHTSAPSHSQEQRAAVKSSCSEHGQIFLIFHHLCRTCWNELIEGEFRNSNTSHSYTCRVLHSW